jgi:uncharacterized damage-inducible protein DinB
MTMEALSIDFLRQLFRHMEWADAEVWRAVLAHQPAARDARLRDLLTHLHRTQRLFLLVWQKQLLDTAWGKADFATAADLRAWAHTYYPEVNRFLETLDESALRATVSMPWIKTFEAQLGRSFSTPTLAETIFQVPSHSTYHRGQVNARLREVGGEPPLVDYIAWIWFGRPEPDWSPAAAAV